jgi:hypothetical protein
MKAAVDKKSAADKVLPPKQPEKSKEVSLNED